jgi:septal ring factor EnvC (AmiA/AmiB activator)
MDCKYIQNVHTNSIKTHFADNREVIFRPDTVDHFSGKQRYTGYTRLTNDEYGKLLKDSALFRHFIELKKLVVHDELPPDAQTPHEALVNARKDVGKLNAELEKANREKEALLVRIGELDTQYRELLAANGGDQLTKAKQDIQEAREQIQALTSENDALKKNIEQAQKDYEALRGEYEKLLKKGK